MRHCAAQVFCTEYACAAQYSESRHYVLFFGGKKVADPPTRKVIIVRVHCSSRLDSKFNKRQAWIVHLALLLIIYAANCSVWLSSRKHVKYIIFFLGNSHHDTCLILLIKLLFIANKFCIVEFLANIPQNFCYHIYIIITYVHIHIPMCVENKPVKGNQIITLLFWAL